MRKKKKKKKKKKEEEEEEEGDRGRWLESKLSWRLRKDRALNSFISTVQESG
jgi:hypothetical protein